MLLSSVRMADDIRCNTIVKRYPNGEAVIMAASRRVFRIPGYEAAVDKVSQKSDSRSIFDPEADYAALERHAILGDGGLSPAEVERARSNLDRAQRRARSAVRDIALSNPMKYFVTLTFDRSRVDRWDDKEVMRVTKNWLDNAVRRHGLAYVLVPERHKDGAIHFHGFFNDAFQGVDSGHKTERGQTIYNLPAWPWGFTVAVEVYGEYAAAVSYCCKYITKGTEKVGGRWYYHGGSLQRPTVEYCNTEWADVSHGQEKRAISGLQDAEMVIIKTEV